MRVKKFLKKESQKNLRDFGTEGDREFLARMKESVAEPPQKKRNKNWLWAIPSAVAACAVAVVLIVEFVPFSGGDLGDANDVNEAKYEEVNFVWTDSDSTELFAALNGLTVNISEERIINVQRTYDSLSGDNLFYTLNIDVFPYSMESRIVVNDKYKFEGFNITESFVTENFSNYSVSYYQTITIDSDTGLNMVQYKAKIESEKYNIYVIDYKEYSLENENGTFLEYIENLFHFSS